MDPAGEGGYSTSSGHRDERILARRARIEAKAASKSDEHSKTAAGAGGGEKKETTEGKQQVLNSLSNLDKTKARSIENVTETRVTADHSENQRRIKEEEKRQARLRRLQDEAVTSGKKNAAVEMQWAELMEVRGRGMCACVCV